MKPMSVDSIAANVHGLDRVLAVLHEMAGLKPFLRFELALPHGMVPVAQVMCGEVSLEFLEHAQGPPPAGTGRITGVTLELPSRGPAVQELEPGLRLEVRPGAKARVAEIQLASGAVGEDLAALRAGCGLGAAAGGGEEALALRLGQVQLLFSHLADPEGSSQRPVDGAQRLPGWHRVGLACRELEAGVAALTSAGLRVEVPPYQVLPGLREAMLQLPSGLVVQPVEQKLWKMLPVVGLRWLGARLRGRRLRFRTREV